MNFGAIIMYLVAGVLGLAALVLFLRLRRPHGEREGYAGFMAATMLAAAAFMLAAYATALWMWSSAP